MKSTLQAGRANRGPVPVGISSSSSEDIAAAAEHVWSTLQAHEVDASKWASADHDTRTQLVTIALAQKPGTNASPGEVVELINQAAALASAPPTGASNVVPIRPSGQASGQAARPAGQITTDTTLADQIPSAPAPSIPSTPVVPIVPQAQPTVPAPTAAQRGQSILQYLRLSCQQWAAMQPDQRIAVLLPIIGPPPPSDPSVSQAPTLSAPQIAASMARDIDTYCASQNVACNPPASWTSDQQRAAWIQANPQCPAPGMFVPSHPVYPVTAHPMKAAPGATFFTFALGALAGWGLAAWLRPGAQG